MTLEDERREQARLALLALRRWKETGFPRSVACRFAWQVAGPASAITGRVRGATEYSYVATERALFAGRWIVWSNGRLSDLRATAPLVAAAVDTDGTQVFAVEFPEQVPFVDEAMTTFEEPILAAGAPNSARWQGEVRLVLDGTARRWRDSGMPCRPPVDRPVLMAALVDALADEVAAVQAASAPTVLPPISVPPRPRDVAPPARRV